MNNKKNTIKRTTTQLKIKTLIDFSGTPKDTVVDLTKTDWGWSGGGYCWFASLIRNSELVEILEQS